MLKTDQFFQIGQVLKSNGTDGQVVISLSAIDAEDISEKEPVFIFFDELPVPYFISRVQRRGSNKILAYMTDVTSLEDAEELAGRGIYLRDDEASDADELDFTGWTVAGLGVVSGIEDIPGNPCLIVKVGTEEVLVPFHEDFIVSIKESDRLIEMNLPEGLI